MYASSLIERVSSDLNDQAPGDEYARWYKADLFDFLVDAERTTVAYKPEAYIRPLVIHLVAGTMQTIPDGSTSYLSPSGATHPRVTEFVKVSRNMGESGTVAGSLIYPIQYKDIDECVPSWRTATESSSVIHYMFDPTDRRRIDVYPPQPSSASTGWIEIVGAVSPPEIVIVGDNYDVSINLGDEYASVIRAYMLYCAYSIDAQNSEMAYQKAISFWNSYTMLIGRKDMIETKLPAKRMAAGQ